MRRRSSIRLFDVLGIRVGVDPSWFLILFLMIFLLSGPFRATLHSSDGVAYLTTVISVLLLFGSLIVHELGHALVARRQGIDVRQIDLFMFGGLTRMSRDAATPAEDFKIGIAGPAATLAVILACVGVDLAIVGAHRLAHAVLLYSDIHITPVLLSLSWLLPMNVLLLAFNLVPAFPLDGGRVARALIWRLTGDKRRGTVGAARMGQAFALLLAAGGVWWLAQYASFAGLWLLALAYLLWQSARGAVVQSALSERIDSVRVADIMDSQPVAIAASTPLGRALDEYFLRYGWPWFPVIDAEGRLLGIARRERVQASFDAGEGWLTVASVLDAGGPGGWGIRQDRPISELLGSEALRTHGALMAVDDTGVLRGVVTAGQLQRAMRSAVTGSMA
ncbi:MAG TPA: site-2 protease family protein [Solirubrobacteraceae bacterium]|nr:site-2 protease family protein [Solirubrobacteraceae bacterium]